VCYPFGTDGERDLVVWVAPDVHFALYSPLVDSLKALQYPLPLGSPSDVVEQIGTCDFTGLDVIRSEAMATSVQIPSKKPALSKARPTALPIADKGHYQPLPSVWHGEDSELLDKLLAFYPRTKPKYILDATVNGGRFWRGSKRPVVGMDIDQAHKPAIVADNTAMPLRDDSFDVIVYDPPHIPNQGKDKSKDFNTRFGLVLRSSKENHYTFTHTFPPFLKEAYRVLRDEGILLCKITDYVHHHRYQWAHIELISAAQRIGFLACDCIIKVREAPIKDPKWKNAHHSRRQHCYWLVFRKSSRCE